MKWKVALGIMVSRYDYITVGRNHSLELCSEKQQYLCVLVCYETHQ